jgi:hypothetical protein
MTAFEEHYFQCEVCFRDLRAAEDALNLIRNEGPAAFKSHVINKGKKAGTFYPEKGFLGKLFAGSASKWIIPSAATAAAVIIILILLPQNSVQVKEESKNLTSLTDTSDRESPDQDDKLVAALSGPAFKPNSYMEEWINEKTRSTGVIVDTVYSPQTGEQFTDSAGQIIFKWKMKNDTAVSLKIMDNAEEEVLTAVPAKINFPEFNIRLNSSVLPQPGLYYWRIETEEEVLYTGKFYFLGKTE